MHASKMPMQLRIIRARALVMKDVTNGIFLDADDIVSVDASKEIVNATTLTGCFALTCREGCEMGKSDPRDRADMKNRTDTEG